MHLFCNKNDKITRASGGFLAEKRDGGAKRTLTHILRGGNALFVSLEKSENILIFWGMMCNLSLILFQEIIVPK